MLEAYLFNFLISIISIINPSIFFHEFPSFDEFASYLPRSETSLVSNCQRPYVTRYGGALCISCTLVVLYISLLRAVFLSSSCRDVVYGRR